MFFKSFLQWLRDESRMVARGPKAVAPRPRRRPCRPQLEELEARLVLNAKVSLSHGLLKVVADNKPTTVTLRQAGSTTIVNQTRVPTRKVKSIQILGGAGNDTISIQDTPAGKSVLVKTGGGNDVIHVGSAANLLSSIKGDLSVDGGAGLDALFLHDSGDQSGQAYTVAADAVSRSGAARIGFSAAVEALTLDAGSGNDQVRVLSTPVATKLALNGGGGVNSLVGLTDGAVSLKDFISPSNRMAEDFNPAIHDLIATGPNLGALAVKLDRDLDLYLPPQNPWENWGGKGEKWMLDGANSQYYFILPNGELYRWDESSGRATTGELVATLDPSYHQDLKQLTEAQSLFASGQIQGPIAEQAARLDRDLGLHVENQDAWLNWGGRNEKWLMSRIDNKWYFLLPNGELHGWDLSNTANGELIATLDSSFYDDLRRLTDARDVFGDLDSMALQAIQRRHDQLGGDAGGMGAAVTDLQTTADGRAWFVEYKYGAIYWTPERGALAVHSGTWQKYKELGGHTSHLGLPTAETTNTLNLATLVTRFENGAIYWSPGTGMHAVYGPIFTKYQALRGERGLLGLPTSDVLTNPDGVGTFVRFQRGVIYSHPGAGTWEVHGAIYDRWAGMDWERSVMGYPISDETSVLGDDYRVSYFQGGTIVWEKATTDTYLVYGLIHGKWQANGGITGWMGAPTSDELDAPGGRVSHFQNASIYYKWGAAEPFEIHGAIRDRYLSMSDGERNQLGLPVTNEQSVLGDDYRISRFEGGTLIWEKATGQTFVVVGHEITLTQYVVTSGATALGGTVNMTIRENGSVRFWGHVHDSGAEGYDFQIRAVFRGNTQVPLVMQKSGYVAGTFTRGSRDFDWDETIQSDAVRDNFFALAANARLDVYENHSGSFTGPLEDVADAALRWVGGTLLITPGVGQVIFAGVELGSLIGTGSLVPGARFLSGTLWMAGPTGSFYALVADGIADAGSRQRELSQEEYDWAQRVFAGTLPPRDQIIVTDTIGGGNRPFVFPSAFGKYTLNIGRDDFNNPRNFGLDKGKVYGQTFIHEMTHVWQLHNTRMGLTWITDALVSQVLNSLGDSAYTYQPGSAYGDYNLEQQAKIVEDWFAGGMDPNSMLYRYIEGNIRLGNPG